MTEGERYLEWLANRRYTVYRTEGYGATKVERVLHAGKTLVEVGPLVQAESTRLALEPNLRAGMGRPLILYRLETPAWQPP